MEQNIQNKNINVKELFNTANTIVKTNTMIPFDMNTSIKKNDTNGNANGNADYKYICIKKEYFDVNMIYLNYTNVKKEKYIEIIYKSPSIFLEGLFFKTPPINLSQIKVIYKDKHNYNYFTIKLVLNEMQIEFINMLSKIDEYITNYIQRFAKDINKEFFKDEHNSMNTIEMFRYDNIIKKRLSNMWELNMKSYLDKQSLDMIMISNNNGNNGDSGNSNFIFTFNITNIYLSNFNIIPLIKCNKCELIL